MKNQLLKIIFSAIILICIAFIWAGFHDIIKGEENITAEIIAIILSMTAIAIVIPRLKKHG